MLLGEVRQRLRPAQGHQIRVSSQEPKDLVSQPLQVKGRQVKPGARLRGESLQRGIRHGCRNNGIARNNPQTMRLPGPGPGPEFRYRAADQSSNSEQQMTHPPAHSTRLNAHRSSPTAIPRDPKWRNN